MNFLKKFETESEYYAFRVSNNFLLPNTSYIKETGKRIYCNKPIKEYLTFVACEAGTFSFSNSGMSYSLDGGKTWTALAASANTPTVESGHTIMWKATPTNTSNSIGTFSSSNSFKVEGNVMSLIFGDNFRRKKSLSGKGLSSLFDGCEYMLDAKNLVLPATSLTNSCYSNMFSNCSSLVVAPRELPANFLTEYCYHNMFSNCTRLTLPPELPAMRLSEGCYDNMFNNCTDLENAPHLPAFHLAEACYYRMFYGCYSLSRISCYAVYFDNLSTEDWVRGVSTTNGYFYSLTNVQWDYGSDSGIPNGWHYTNNGYYMYIDDFIFEDEPEIWHYDYGYQTWDDFASEVYGFSDEQDLIEAFTEEPDAMGSNYYVSGGDYFEFEGEKYYIWIVREPLDAIDYVEFVLTDKHPYDYIGITLEAKVKPYIVKLDTNLNEYCSGETDYIVKAGEF